VTARAGIRGFARGPRRAPFARLRAAEPRHRASRRQQQLPRDPSGRRARVADLRVDGGVAPPEAASRVADPLAVKVDPDERLGVRGVERPEDTREVLRGLRPAAVDVARPVAPLGAEPLVEPRAPDAGPELRERSVPCDDAEERLGRAARAVEARETGLEERDERVLRAILDVRVRRGEPEHGRGGPPRVIPQRLPSGALGA
jgi:hypothetical protein